MRFSTTPATRRLLRGKVLLALPIEVSLPASCFVCVCGVGAGVGVCVVWDAVWWYPTASLFSPMM